MLESFIPHVVERNKEVEHNVMTKPSFVNAIGWKGRLYPIGGKSYLMQMMLLSNRRMHVLEAMA